VPASLGLFTYSPDKPFDVPVWGVTEYVENTVLKQDQKGLNRLRPFLKVKDKSTAKKPLSTVSQKEAVDAAVNLISEAERLEKNDTIGGPTDVFVITKAGNSYKRLPK